MSDRDLLSPTFLAKLEQLRLVNRKLSRGLYAGSRQSSLLGSSLEFADYRPYFPGDDVRQVDWFAYARLGKWFLKTFLDERETEFQFLIDTSQSMDTTQMSKRQRTIQLAAALGYLALINGDRVGVSTFRKRINQQLPIGQGRSMIHRLFSFLSALDFAGSGDVNQALRQSSVNTKQPRNYFLFTDGLYEHGMEAGISYLQSAGHQVSLLHVIAPQERDPSYQGDLRLIDSESSVEKEVVFSPTVLKRYRENVQQFIQHLQSMCVRRGVAYVEIHVEKPLEQIIFDILHRMNLVR